MNSDTLAAAVWSFEDLQPGSRRFELGAARRTDPYYSMSWGYPAAVGWLRPRAADLAFTTRPARHMRSLHDQQALTFMLEAGTRTTRHSVDVHSTLLGAVHGWKTCTSEQVAALTRRTDFWTGDSLPYATAVRAGIVDLGLLADGRGGPRVLASPKPHDAHRVLLNRLDLRQVLEVTGGEPWTRGPAGARHNVLATELGLRIAEYAENVGTVLPESYSRLHHLAGPDRPSPYPRPRVSRRAADLAVVRADGLKIAVELTASRGENLERKVCAYARLFAGGVHGLAVVFVVAPSTDAAAPAPGKIRSLVQRVIQEHVREVPGSSFDPTAHRFGVVSWEDWFPGPGLVSERFFDLTAQRPPDTGQKSWQPAAFLDEASVALDPEGLGRIKVAEDGWLRPVEFARLLGSTPHWMRGGPHPAARRELGAWVLDDERSATPLRSAMFTVAPADDPVSVGCKPSDP